MVKPRETTWNDVKTELLQFDRKGLLGLLKDLYALRPENRAFLARIMHHADHFRTPPRPSRDGNPSSRIGVRQLGLQRVCG